MAFDVSVAVPVFNNQDTLEQLLLRLDTMARSLFEKYGWNVQCVLVDDASSDNSRSILESFEPLHISLTIAGHKKNTGQPVAILHAWTLCEGKRIVTMAADLQDPPEVVAELVESVEAGADVAIGRRVARSDQRWQMISSKYATRMLTKDLAVEIDSWFDFFAMSDEILNSMREMRGGRRFIQADVLRHAADVRFIDYERQARSSSTGNTIRKRWRIFSDSAIASTMLPIRLVVRGALLIAALAVLWSLIIIVGSALGAVSPSGWAPLMLAVLSIGSGLLAATAMSISYLYRIYEIARNVPLFVEDKARFTSRPLQTGHAARHWPEVVEPEEDR